MRWKLITGTRDKLIHFYETLVNMLTDAGLKIGVRIEPPAIKYRKARCLVAEMPVTFGRQLRAPGG